MRRLSTRDVARARLVSLLLRGTAAATPLDVATWFGAMQAQDLASGKWSFGVRLPDWGEADIDAAIERGDILRTWPMRGTIHFIPPADARWMLELTGRRALPAATRTHAALGLDDATFDSAATALEAALRGGHRLTRSQAKETLGAAGIDTGGQRGYHLLWRTSILGITCIGPQSGAEQTFVLLDEWAPDQRTLDRDDALRELALRYFRSHGPAGVEDFAGWSGLTLTDARAGVAACAAELTQAEMDGRVLVLTRALDDALADGAARSAGPTHALPGFDEFMLGYRDRGVQVLGGLLDRVVPGGNGVFRPTLCADGRVLGTWTRRDRRARVDAHLEPFAPLTAAQGRAADAAFAAYARYRGVPVAWRIEDTAPVT